jgi:starvation-inducible DNA-binding protein
MLEQDLNVLLASTFGMALKAQRYHWNVMGMNFYQLHEFYEEVYDDLYEHVDIIAEAIRSMGRYPAGSFAEYVELSQISEEDTVVTDAEDQLSELVRANDVVLRVIKIAMTAAEDEGAEDILDLLVNRMRQHKKHGWMLNSFLEQQQRQ